VDEATRWLPADASPETGDTGMPPVLGERSGGVPASETRGGRIVLADDNSDMRDYLRRVLSDYYEVIAVPDGEAAWEFARGNPVDLVLTDVMMPRMDGFELLRHLRGDPATRAVPVILLSARAGEESRVEGLEAGADDYLIKPFTVRELLARVDAHMRMARIRKETVNLQESELRFRTMADCAPVMVWTCGADGGPQYFNTGWRKFTGTAAGEWTGSVHAEDRARCIAAFTQAAAECGRFDLEFRLRHHDGEHRWVFCSGAPRLLPGGEFLGYTFSCVDIQDRKSVERELHLSRERLQLALDAANEGLWDWNLVTGANYYGPRYYTILGYAAGELPAAYDTWLNLLHPDDRETAVEQRNRQIAQRGGTFTTEYRLRKKNGEYTWIQSRGKVVAWQPDGSQGRIVGTITDITERRRLEEQFYQSQRLESVGRLAGAWPTTSTISFP
jgi:PAS domain S-box-containing protein